MRRSARAKKARTKRAEESKKEQVMIGIKKIILKDDGGNAQSVLTLRLGGEPTISLPTGVRPIALETNGEILPASEGKLPPLPSEIRELSVLAENAEGRLFATTRKGEEGTLAKWSLIARTTIGKPIAKVPATPLETPTPEKTEKGATESGEDLAETQKPDEDAPSVKSEEDPIAKANRLIEEGEPFDLFRDLMPNSRWAKIENDECLCLVGIVRDGDTERVLYGVAGAPGYPPDEEKLWTYFPTSEEEGYFLTEYEQQ